MCCVVVSLSSFACVSVVCVFSSSLALTSISLLFAFLIFFQCEFLVFTSDPLLFILLFSLFNDLLSFAFLSRFSIVSVVVVTLLLLLLNFFVRLHFLDALIYRRLSTLKFFTCFVSLLLIDFACFLL